MATRSISYHVAMFKWYDCKLTKSGLILNCQCIARRTVTSVSLSNCWRFLKITTSTFRPPAPSLSGWTSPSTSVMFWRSTRWRSLDSQTLFLPIQKRKYIEDQIQWKFKSFSLSRYPKKIIRLHWTKQKSDLHIFH